MPYTVPTAAALKVRYPGFADVADDTVEAAITDAARGVDSTWTEGDYQPAIMALAAHLMTLEGQGTSTEAQLAGIRALRVGSLSLERTNSAGDAGSLGSTMFGQRYLALLRANRGGGVVVQPDGT